MIITVISLRRTSGRVAARRIRSNFNLFFYIKQQIQIQIKQLTIDEHRPSIESNKTIVLVNEEYLPGIKLDS